MNPLPVLTALACAAPPPKKKDGCSRSEEVLEGILGSGSDPVPPVECGAMVYPKWMSNSHPLLSSELGAGLEAVLDAES